MRSQYRHGLNVCYVIASNRRMRYLPLPPARLPSSRPVHKKSRCLCHPVTGSRAQCIPMRAFRPSNEVFGRRHSIQCLCERFRLLHRTVSVYQIVFRFSCHSNARMILHYEAGWHGSSPFRFSLVSHTDCNFPALQCYHRFSPFDL